MEHSEMKTEMKKGIIIGLLLTAMMIAYQNCGKQMSFNALKPLPPEAVVCGGFDEGSLDVQKFGIVGNIYVSDKEHDPGAAFKYPTEATPLTTPAGDLISMYLNNINVPTRDFTAGFINQNGDALTDTDGNVLIEYFGLKLRFSLMLPQDYQEGYYQVAVESDDGSLLQTLNENNEMVTLINNDRTQATAAKCANKAIYFDHTTRVPSELYYFQGPRMRIALRLVWRKVDQQNTKDLCESLGSADGTSESHNWKVIPPTAYELPISEQSNPCTNK
jgi:hypothetical protein